MTIKVTQMFATMTGDTEKRQVDYLVSDVGDEEQAMGAVYDAAPSRLTSNPYMVLDNVSVKEIDKKACIADVTANGIEFGGNADGNVKDGLYIVTAHYVNQSSPSQGSPPVPEDGEPDLEEEEVRLKQHTFNQSLENVQEYTNLVGETKYYNDGTINIKVGGIHPRGEQGDYEGVSVRRPIGSYVISYYPSAERATQTYLDSIKDMVGSVNSTTFQGYAPGEVLLLSAQGSGFNETNFDLQFTFEVRRNKTAQTITDLNGNIITYDVKGHEYAWVDYEEIVEAEIVTQNPRQVIVEELYPSVDLNALFLPPA